MLTRCSFCFLRRCLATWFAVTLSIACVSLNAQQGWQVYEQDGRVCVEALADAQPQRTGLVIWSGNPASEVTYWSPSASTDRSAVSTPAESYALLGKSRGASTSAQDQNAFRPSQSIAPLITGAKRRDARLSVVPGNGAVLLDNQPTFRRVETGEASGKELKFAILANSGKTLMQFVLAPNQSALKWQDIADLPAHLRDGLPAGTYGIQIVGEIGRATFRVADTQSRTRWKHKLAQLAQCSSDMATGLYELCAVQDLLSYREGNTYIYLADAWKLVDGIADSAVKESLATVISSIAEVGKASPPADQGSDATGIPAIDALRGLLDSGNWQLAAEQLDKISTDDPRTAAYVSACRAELVGETGLLQSSLVEQYYQEALQKLGDDFPADRLRLLNNRATFHLRVAQDCINNHAFQQAAGVARPLTQMLALWRLAESEYQQVLTLSATTKDAKAASLAALNLARTYELLFDVLLVTEPADAPSGYTSLKKSTAVAIDNWLTQAEKNSAPGMVSYAAEIRAHLAYRQGDWKNCKQQALVAVQANVKAGSLPGVESALRLVGLASAELGESQPSLHSFLLSHSISETLRRQVAVDTLGVGRAGFFARRSYVYEQIVKLLIDKHDYKNALKYAELSKARTAHDLRVTKALESHDDKDSATTSQEWTDEATLADNLDELLAGWSPDTVALEYLLGSRDCFVFVISGNGQVEAYPLRDAAGENLDPQMLVAKVRTFLKSSEQQAGKMQRSIIAGRGFPWSWQDDLHGFYQTLIPAQAVAKLKAASQLLVIPHHVLHYFPFAALVTEVDSHPVDSSRLPHPKFLIDQPLDVLSAPSLLLWDEIASSDTVEIDRAQAIGLSEVPGAAALPGVERDLKEFEKLFGASVKRILQGSEATPAKALELLGDPGVLLVACHGFNEADRPLDSYLMLHPDAHSPSGHLTTKDILNVKVRSSVVVMNACYSGLGDRSPLPGDDLFGLQRALLTSGAKCVVSGLWDVYDDTAPEIIGSFLRDLRSQVPASKAMANAQRDFLESQRKSSPEPYLHPYFWAVFTISGS